MRYEKMKKYIALFTCSIAMFTATTSSAMCWSFLFGEPKMPKSLYKMD